MNIMQLALAVVMLMGSISSLNAAPKKEAALSPKEVATKKMDTRKKVIEQVSQDVPVKSQAQ
jgi:hypothetical protein